MTGTTKRRLGVALAFAILLVLGLWQVGPGESESPSPPTSAAVDAPGPSKKEVRRSTSPQAQRGAIELMPARLSRESIDHGAFEGLVLDSSTGEPIAEAELAFQGDLGIETVSSDEEGRFRFEPSDAGTYRLSIASKDGYLPFAPVLGTSPIVLSPREGIVVGGLRIYIDPATVYTGVVLDTADEVTPGATVELQLGGGASALVPMKTRFETDARGEFRFRAPEGAVLVAHHGELVGSGMVNPGVVESGRMRIQLAPAGPAEGTRHIAPVDDEPLGGILRGRVVDGNGRPVPSFHVVVFDRTGPMARSRVGHQTVIAADGRFEVSGLEEKSYEVVALAHGLARSEPTAAVASESPREVELRLNVGATIFGVVRDAESGEGIAGAKVTMETSLGSGGGAIPILDTALSDASGAFELAGVDAGRASLVVHALGHHSAIVGGIEAAEGTRSGPHTALLQPKSPDEEHKLELVGIGAVIQGADAGLRIGRVMPDGGADDAGLRQEDVIVEIDGARALELGFEGSLQRIRGPAGTTVRLLILRAGEERAMLVTRKKMRF